MKKMLILLILILFLSGCSGEYNLTIKKNSFIENIDVTLSEKDLNRNTVYPESYFPPWEVLDDSYYALTTQSDSGLYKKNITDFNNGKKVILSYVYTPSSFNNSMLLNSCFDNYEYINERKFILININKMVDCIYVEPLRINIKTDLEVLENNADEVNKNNYTWILTEENSFSKNIMIKISKENLNNEENKKNITYIIILIFLILVLIFLLIRKSKKNNEI